MSFSGPSCTTLTSLKGSVAGRTSNHPTPGTNLESFPQSISCHAEGYQVDWSDITEKQNKTFNHSLVNFCKSCPTAVGLPYRLLWVQIQLRGLQRHRVNVFGILSHLLWQIGKVISSFV